MECVGEPCGRLALRVLAGVPLCLEHIQALRAELHVPEPPPPPPTPGTPQYGSVVYYLSHAHRPLIKIGVTQNLRKRARALSSMASPVHVLAVEPGGYYLERKRHRQFTPLRNPGSEWFRRTDWLLSHIHTLREVHGVPPCTCPGFSGGACPAEV